MDCADCVIIGGGPAGLTAAYELSKLGKSSVILESDEMVGGLSRTCEYRGYRFDVGGHRFFTKVDYVQQLWEEILQEDFLTRPRLSRIYYRGKLFDYPLKPLNALLGLGPIEAFRIALSYARVFFFPHVEEHNFEDWVRNRFGRRLYEIFFKTYTEKVWGMPCREISADWAAQRIKNLDLVAAIRNALLGSGAKKKDGLITTLIDEFQYPRLGPGQMWSRCSAALKDSGGEVRLNSRAVSLEHDGQHVSKVLVESNGSGKTELKSQSFISSMPVRELLNCFDPKPPEHVLDAANQLRYRDFLTVALIVDRPHVFPDNWIYIHSEEVQVGRIQNYKNWSEEMVPDASKTALGLEYFVQEGDELWEMDDDALVELGRRECDQLGLVPADSVDDGTVLRMHKAYPVYDDEYKRSLEIIRDWLNRLTNLQLIGRNGQHRYNNQDHSMMTGVYAARNVVKKQYDTWSVNVEQEYHEEQKQSGDRLVPQASKTDHFDELLSQTFARYSPTALGGACAAVTGLLLFFTTATLLLRGGDSVGANLSLLSNYFLGYDVTWIGSLIGLVEGTMYGWVFGFVVAKLINAVVTIEQRKLISQIVSSNILDLYGTSWMNGTDGETARAHLQVATARLRARVMSLVFGMVGGTGLFLMTIWLILRGGEDVGAHLSLLRHYFFGYSVTWTGAFVGLVYGALSGAVVGYLTARIYNRVATHSPVE